MRDRERVAAIATSRADRSGMMAGVERLTGLEQFILILTLPDNVPIIAMMLLVLFFTFVAFKQARRNDQLIEHGQRDRIIEEMRK